MSQVWKWFRYLKSKHTDPEVSSVAISRGVNTCLWVAGMKYKTMLGISTSAERVQHRKIQNTSTNVSIVKKQVPPS